MTVTALPSGRSATFSGTASDADGSISSVTVSLGGTGIGTAVLGVGGSTWSLSVTTSSALTGLYDVVGTATDDLGISTNSAPVQVRMVKPPGVTLTIPSAGAHLTLGVSFDLEGTYTSPDSTATVSHVNIYEGTTLLGTATLSSGAWLYSYTPTGSPGSRTLYAEVVDGYSIATKTSGTAVTIDLPYAVAVLSPTAGTVVASGRNCTVSGSYSIPSPRTVSQIELFVAGVSQGLATDSGSGIWTKTYTVSSSYTGAKDVTAVITNDLSATATSSAVSLTYDKPPQVSITSPTN